MALTILAIEDNPADQELMARLFSKLGADLHLRLAADGEQALRYLYRTCEYADPETSPRPDLVLLDINLPRMAGTDVLQRIRSQPELENIPVVVVSSSTYERDIKRCKKYGCSGIVTKSIDLEAFRGDLLAAAKHWLPELA